MDPADGEPAIPCPDDPRTLIRISARKFDGFAKVLTAGNCHPSIVTGQVQIFGGCRRRGGSPDASEFQMRSTNRLPGLTMLSNGMAPLPTTDLSQSAPFLVHRVRS